jgi:Mn2+/Fe2+ NRAMP family transporter
MKKFVLIALVAIACMMAGCATITLPGKSPVQLSQVNASASKVGTATGKVWFGIFGNAIFPSAIEAAQNGGITRIAAVETSIKPGILGLWIDYTTTVAGE